MQERKEADSQAELNELWIYVLKISFRVLRLLRIRSNLPK
jgi:hypothetical protein